MKKCYIVGICLIMTCMWVIMSGCGREKIPVGTRKYSVYYPDREENKILSKDYYSANKDTELLIDELICELSTSPEDVNLRETVRDFEIESYEISDKQLSLQISEEYKNIEPTTEILVRAAIVRTLTQVRGISYVSMHYSQEDMLDALGQPVGLMSAEQFIDNTGNEINSYEMVELKLYFASRDGNRLIPTKRTVVYNSNISMEKLVVEQLIKGPESDNIAPVINPETEIINVTVKDGTCYVNLNSAFLTSENIVVPELTVYSITNSLVELPNVNKVQFSVDGETEISISENISLNVPFERNLDLVR
ncbi:MAG: GerMN domain-containing protein [Lachnospiraceae bacterium]|nr:GerMN domain-containing protein [Candidatus Colinaster equi]